MVEIESVSISKTKDDAPISGDPYGVKSGIVAAQGVKLETGNVDILDLPSLVDDGKSVFDSTNLVGGYSARVAVLEEFA